MRKWISLCERSDSDFADLLATIKDTTGALVEARVEDREIILEYIERGIERGSGYRALKSIIDYADKFGMPIILSVLHSSPKLIRYYRRCGFTVEGVAERDFPAWFEKFEAEWDIETVEEEIAMRRQPNAPPLITEAFHSAFEGHRATCEVFKNPSKKELAPLVKYDDVRAFLVGDDIYVWDCFSALHQNVREHLGLGPKAIPLVLSFDPSLETVSATVTDNSKNTPVHHNPEIINEIRNHPFIRRFEWEGLSYYDEAIVGTWDDLDHEEMTEGANTAIPDDPYGYWIMPDGRAIPTAVQSHIDSAIEQLGIDPDLANQELENDHNGEYNFNTRYSAIAKGGIRVISLHGEFNVQLENPTIEGLRTLLRIIPRYRHVEKFYIESPDDNGRTPKTAAETMRLVRRWLVDLRDDLTESVSVHNILIDPTAREYVRFLRETESQGEARGLLYGERLYVWDSYQYTHREAALRLGIDQSRCIELVMNSRRIEFRGVGHVADDYRDATNEDWAENRAVAVELANNASIRRIFGSSPEVDIYWP